MASDLLLDHKECVTRGLAYARPAALRLTLFMT